MIVDGVRRSVTKVRRQLAIGLIAASLMTIAVACGHNTSTASTVTRSPTPSPSDTNRPGATTYTDQIAGFRLTLFAPLREGAGPTSGSGLEALQTWTRRVHGFVQLGGDDASESFIFYSVNAADQTWRARLTAPSNAYARSLVERLSQQSSYRLVFIKRIDTRGLSMPALAFVFNQTLRKSGVVYTVDALLAYRESPQRVVYVLIAAAPRSVWKTIGPTLQRTLTSFSLLS